MISPSSALLPVAALVAVLGCTASREDRVPYGNPAGYAVHVLTGAGSSAQQVTVNDRAIDSSSVAAIDASVRAILDSVDAPSTVEEVSAVAPDLTVDFTGSATPVPRTFRAADLQWRSKFFLEDARWKALVRHAGLGLLRFPAGQERVRYDGSASVSGTPETDTLTVADGQPYEYRLSGEDVAHYIALCRELGIAAQPQINTTVDDPEQAAAFVRQIVDDLGYDLRYVSVGNEPDVGAHAGNWEALGATGSTEAERRASALAHYTARYLAYRRRIDAVRPGLTYAFAELGSWFPGDQGRYLDALLAGLGGDQPGAVSGHWYPLGDYGQASTSYDYPAVENLVVSGHGNYGIAHLGDVAAGLREHAAAAGLAAPKIFIGEFGVSWSATGADARVADRLAAALFNAEAQETAKAAGVDALTWFGLSDPSSSAPWVPSLIAVDDASGTPHPRPQYYVYLLYRYLYGDETVAVPGGQQADWSIYASRSSTGTKRYFLLINRSEHARVSRIVRALTAGGEKLLRLTAYPHSIAVVEF